MRSLWLVFVFRISNNYRRINFNADSNASLFSQNLSSYQVTDENKRKKQFDPGLELLIAYFLTIGIQMKVEFDESEKIGLRNDFSKITPLWPAVQWQWVSWKQYENICKCNIPCVPAIDGGQLDLSGILNAGHWACELDLRSNLCPLCCHLYIRLGSYLLFSISLDDTWEYNYII